MRVAAAGVLLAVACSTTGTPPKAAPSSTPPTASPTTATATPTPSPTPALAAVTLVTQTRRGGTKTQRWTAAYPALRGLPPAAATKANAALTAAVDGYLVPDPELGASTTDVSADLSAVDDHYVTVRMFVDVYPEGAAHGFQVVQTYVFERATGRRLTLPDFFTPGDRDSALRAMSSYLRRRLPSVTDPFDDESFESGTMPDPDNFETITPLPEGLEVTFQSYQVAPYAVGHPVAVVPWSEIEAYVAVPLPSGDRTPPYRDGHRPAGAALRTITRAAARDPRAGTAELTRVQQPQAFTEDGRGWAIGTLPDGDLVALRESAGRWRVVDVGPSAGCTAFPRVVRTALALRCS